MNCGQTDLKIRFGVKLNHRYPRTIVITDHRHLRTILQVRTVKNHKVGSKRRTDLKVRPCKVKNLEESGFDVKTHLAPPKSVDNDEKLISESKIISKKRFSTVEKSQLASLLKRALPKFRGYRS